MQLSCRKVAAFKEEINSIFRRCLRSLRVRGGTGSVNPIPQKWGIGGELDGELDLVEKWLLSVGKEGYIYKYYVL